MGRTSSVAIVADVQQVVDHAAAIQDAHQLVSRRL
jgi:hypothetical protein